jgi:transcriptional adapter 3
VNEDFSHSKQHNNPVQLSTFWTTVEHYLRDVSEDDLAMLGFRVS